MPGKEIVWEFCTPYRGILFGHEASNIYRTTRYSGEYCRLLLGWR